MTNLQAFAGRKNVLAEPETRGGSASPEIAIRQQRSGDSPVEDADLIRSLQDGCEESFDLLFARYWKLVFSIAWRILRQRSEAEDIVQDVFLAIYLKSDRYDSTRGSVRTWIAQFAHFKALVRRRAMQTSELTNLDEFKEFEAGVMQFGSAEGVLERAALVEQCLATLNPRQRRTVELVHFDGYTLIETATILRQSVANTRNLYYRGLNSVRTQLGAGHKLPLEKDARVAETLSNVPTESFILGDL